MTYWYPFTLIDKIDPENVVSQLGLHCLPMSLIFSALSIHIYGLTLCLQCILQDFRNTIRVSNSLDPDQTRRFVESDQGQNSFQRLSADVQRVKTASLWMISACIAK